MLDASVTLACVLVFFVPPSSWKLVAVSFPGFKTPCDLKKYKEDSKLVQSLEIGNQYVFDIESAKASLAMLSAPFPVLVFAFAFARSCAACYAYFLLVESI